MKTLTTLTAISCSTFCALAQPASAPLGFDVASIKPSPPIPTGPNHSMFVGMKRDPVRVSFSNVPLKYLIRTAYDFDTSARIEGGPGWLDSDMYDVTGTFPASTTNDQMLRMLQSLLSDRCKLAVRRESRVQAVYAFVVAKAVQNSNSTIQLIGVTGTAAAKDTSNCITSPSRNWVTSCTTSWRGPSSIRPAFPALGMSCWTGRPSTRQATIPRRPDLRSSRPSRSNWASSSKPSARQSNI